MRLTPLQKAIENVDQCLNSEDIKSMLGELLEYERINIINSQLEVLIELTELDGGTTINSRIIITDLKHQLNNDL